MSNATYLLYAVQNIGKEAYLLEKLNSGGNLGGGEGRRLPPSRKIDEFSEILA